MSDKEPQLSKAPSATGVVVKDRAMDQIQGTPLFPLQYVELRKLAKLLFKSSLPTAIASVSININALVCLKFIGELNESIMLAGASLGITWGKHFLYCNNYKHQSRLSCTCITSVWGWTVSKAGHSISEKPFCFRNHCDSIDSIPMVCWKYL